MGQKLLFYEPCRQKNLPEHQIHHKKAHYLANLVRLNPKMEQYLDHRPKVDTNFLMAAPSFAHVQARLQQVQKLISFFRKIERIERGGCFKRQKSHDT